MPAKSQTEIHVPALAENGKIIVPEFRLGELECRQDDWDKYISPAEWIKIKELPRLKELRHAFFDAVDGTVITFERNEKGKYVPTRTDYVSTEYRQSVLSRPGLAEWTSTFVKPRGPHKGEVIPPGYRPVTIINLNRKKDRLFKKPQARDWEWQIEYGSRNAFDRLAPPLGWTLEYDKETGLPIKTSPKLKDAEEVFGGDVSCFLAEINGVETVMRSFKLNDNYGPFCIDTRYPGFQSSYFAFIPTSFEARSRRRYK